MEIEITSEGIPWPSDSPINQEPRPFSIETGFFLGFTFMTLVSPEFPLKARLVALTISSLFLISSLELEIPSFPAHEFFFHAIGGGMAGSLLINLFAHH